MGPPCAEKTRLPCAVHTGAVIEAWLDLGVRAHRNVSALPFGPDPGSEPTAPSGCGLGCTGVWECGSRVCSPGGPAPPSPRLHEFSLCFCPDPKSHGRKLS